MSGAVEWQQLAFIVGLIVTAGVIVASVVLWLWGRMSKIETDHRRDVEALRKVHDDAIDRVARQQSDLRVEIARDYTSNSDLARFEARIETALGQMIERFERGLDRVAQMFSNGGEKN